MRPMDMVVVAPLDSSAEVVTETMWSQAQPHMQQCVERRCTEEFGDVDCLIELVKWERLNWAKFMGGDWGAWLRATYKVTPTAGTFS